jgi:hypothetical protein
MRQRDLAFGSSQTPIHQKILIIVVSLEMNLLEKIIFDM